MAELRFKRDTEFRKGFFVPDSFSHPAKMDAQLLIWLVEHFTQPGETILDPMFGSGTTMLACTLGRNVIGVELEQKFIRMSLNNWQVTRMHPQLGYGMGECYCLWGDSRDILSAREHPYQDLWLGYPKLGYAAIKAIRRHERLPLKNDARNLEGLLADVVITSPPFADAEHNYNHGLKVLGPNFKGRKAWETKGKADAIITSPPYEGSLELSSRHTKGGIPGRDAKLGQTGTYADVVISSPPYAGNTGGLKSARSFKYGDDPIGERMMGGIKGGTGEHPDNIDALPYGSIDAILTSPPYEGSISDGREKILSIDGTKSSDWHPGEYSQVNLKHNYGGENNIGNLKAASYLEAMALVYTQCHAVLKDGGLMVLVVKNFIRNKAVVRLDLDTIKLCEQAGFSLIDQYRRKLLGRSFWRTLYQRKYPGVETIDFEDVLVFREQAG